MIKLMRGKTYRVRVDGKEGLVKYDGPEDPPNHCKTCTCAGDSTQIFVQVEGEIYVGRAKEFEILEEII